METEHDPAIVGLGEMSANPLRCFTSPTLKEAGFTVLATGALFFPLVLARTIQMVPKWPWQIFPEVFQDIRRQRNAGVRQSP